MITKFNTFNIDELKLVYLILHRDLMKTAGLMDSIFLEELQTHLHSLAKSDGIDVQNHTEWETWLGKSRL
jgi:hypothetical protein